MRHRYLISDHEHNPIAQAVLESEPGSEPLHLNILNDRAELVANTVDICLIALDEEDLTFRGRAGYRYGDCVVVAPVELLGPAARRNLRVPTRFESYLYPVSGDWKGQRAFICKDLSCGGIAFQTSQPLEIGEIIQVVIAPMRHPMLVQAQILRPLTAEKGGERSYASKFVDLCDDEDKALREAVFSIQLAKR